MRHDHVPSEQLRISDDLGDGVHRADDHPCGTEDFAELRGGVLCRPRADQVVDLVLVPTSGGVIAKPLVGGQLGLPIAVGSRAKTLS